VTERGELRQVTARALGQDESEGVASGTFYSGQYDRGLLEGAALEGAALEGAAFDGGHFEKPSLDKQIEKPLQTFGGVSPASVKPLADPLGKRDAKPSHYKVICISMYTDDLKRLDRMVEELKSRGLTKANRSALIRYALGEVDLERVPKGL
jgi:hypothetical protein